MTVASIFSSLSRYLVETIPIWITEVGAGTGPRSFGKAVGLADVLRRVEVHRTRLAEGPRMTPNGCATFGRP
jgi:hypothetical protein